MPVGAPSSLQEDEQPSCHVRLRLTCCLCWPGCDCALHKVFLQTAAARALGFHHEAALLRDWESVNLTLGCTLPALKAWSADEDGCSRETSGSLQEGQVIWCRLLLRMLQTWDSDISPL